MATYDDYSDENVEPHINEIDPRDSYGSRFEVTSRRVIDNSSPRSAVTAGKRHIRNSAKIFTKRHDHNDLGGSVNIKNINIGKETKLADSKEVDKITTENKAKAKSSGLDSLFESTTEVVKQTAEATKAKIVSQAEQIKNKDTRRVVAKDNISSTGQNRKLKILKPISYNSAKEISSALKSGSAVVLCLKGINDTTAKRLLDFSFGAASMCGAHVSIEADKTYVITIGPGLSQREKLLCIKEGVALKVEE